MDFSDFPSLLYTVILLSGPYRCNYFQRFMIRCSLGDTEINDFKKNRAESDEFTLSIEKRLII